VKIQVEVTTIAPPFNFAELYEKTEESSVIPSVPWIAPPKQAIKLNKLQIRLMWHIYAGQMTADNGIDNRV
jgi:hypothetical protein